MLFVGALSLGCTAVDPELPEALDDAVPSPAESIPPLDVDGTPVELHVRFVRQGCVDGVHIGSRGSLEAWDDGLFIGGSHRMFLRAGEFVDGRWSPSQFLETAAVTSNDGIERLRNEPAPHEWTIDVTRVASVRPREYAFDIAWRHVLAERVGHPRQIAGDARRISLAEGDSLLLDRVALPLGPDGCDRSVSIDLRAVPQENEVFADRMLVYDVWFVHTQPDGTTIDRHTSVSALHGKTVDFRMPTMRPDQASLMLDDDPLQLVITPKGTLRGRLRDDGQIDLAVEAKVEQLMTFASEVEPRGAGSTSAGSHGYRISPGQTLRLDLSPPRGHWTRTTATATQTIDLAEALAGHSDALVVTVDVE